MIKLYKKTLNFKKIVKVIFFSKGWESNSIRKKLKTNEIIKKKLKLSQIKKYQENNDDQKWQIKKIKKQNLISQII